MTCRYNSLQFHMAHSPKQESQFILDDLTEVLQSLTEISHQNN